MPELPNIQTTKILMTFFGLDKKIFVLKHLHSYMVSPTLLLFFQATFQYVPVRANKTLRG